MTVESTVDNDVLIKLARYGLLGAGILAAVLPPAVGVLSSARYVAENRLKRGCPAPQLEAALAQLRAYLSSAEALEPSPAEIEFALELEDEAQRRGLALDAGESQLASITLSRGVRVLATGDKRALNAFAQLAEAVTRLGALRGRALCLEQLAVHLVTTLGLEPVRRAVCADPTADRALTICFQCRSQAVGSADVLGALLSYIEDLRRSCQGLLAVA